MQICLLTLENGTEAGKKIAREEILNCAKLADALNEKLQRERDNTPRIPICNNLQLPLRQ